MVETDIWIDIEKQTEIETEKHTYR